MTDLVQLAGRLLIMLGINPRQKLGLRNIVRYLRDRASWKSNGGTISHIYPILTDFEEQAGNIKGHYFHQDLLVAGFVFEQKPERHIDIGSRVDGFVAHVASFRKIEVFDIRLLDNSSHSNIQFVQKDLMTDVEEAIADSISCLHAIEHFGLGRYNDPINPNGHIVGLTNIVHMLVPNGLLYISFPIGKSNEVHFNAHRVFSPCSILGWDIVKETLVIERFDWVDDYGELHVDETVEDAVGKVRFGCGIYTFRKRSNLYL